ncbi:MAG: GNAT family N-acetyltransferase [Phaeodactylibacter sp.]|nr:GNAT family N-acetyltransferase [Phaeodactylibacter sp.]MCB9266090.1 GNAT family N-acetyltransferase [Lewinellaceae bacterium]MCB9289283.1 GNAT family N-acetyltransferase [Lewinellaceae bacterium]
MKQVTAFQIAEKPSPDQIVSIHDDFTLEVCLDEKSKRLAFQIRYRAYLEAGMIPENEEGMFYDEDDYQPNSRIFLVWYQDKAVATVRSCVYSDAYGWMPTEGVLHFREELSNKIGTHTRLLESNRFAVDPTFQGRQSLFARFLLFRGHGLNAAVHQCKYIVTSVKANHIAFYQRFLNLEPISPEPHYYEWLEADVSLLMNETDTCLNSILKRGMPGYDQEDIRCFAICAYVPLIDGQAQAA